nr:uncharacterized protein LOC127493623 [Oryctolagus cuniculus]
MAAAVSAFFLLPASAAPFFLRGSAASPAGSFREPFGSPRAAGGKSPRPGTVRPAGALSPPPALPLPASSSRRGGRDSRNSPFFSAKFFTTWAQPIFSRPPSASSPRAAGRAAGRSWGRPRFLSSSAPPPVAILPPSQHPPLAPAAKGRPSRAPARRGPWGLGAFFFFFLMLLLRKEAEA